jgi:hypothetical protein
MKVKNKRDIDYSDSMSDVSEIDFEEERYKKSKLKGLMNDFKEKRRNNSLSRSNKKNRK